MHYTWNNWEENVKQFMSFFENKNGNLIMTVNDDFMSYIFHECPDNRIEFMGYTLQVHYQYTTERPVIHVFKDNAFLDVYLGDTFGFTKNRVIIYEKKKPIIYYVNPNNVDFGEYENLNG